MKPHYVSFYKAIFSANTCQVRTEWNACKMENLQWKCQEGIKEKTLVTQVPVRPYLVGLIATLCTPPPTAQTGQLSVPQAPQCSLIYTSAFAVRSAPEGLSSHVLMPPSFCAFRHWFICHLLSEAFCNHLILRFNSLHNLFSSALIILHSKYFI